MRTVRRQSSPASTSHRTIADGSLVSLMLCSMRSRIGHVALLIVFAYSCMRTVPRAIGFYRRRNFRETGRRRAITLEPGGHTLETVSYTHLRAHETRHDLVC